MRQGSVGGRPYLKTSTDTSSFEPSPTWPIKIHIILIITRSGKSITSSFAHFLLRIRMMIKQINFSFLTFILEIIHVKAGTYT